jgi:hypothetical protein
MNSKLIKACAAGAAVVALAAAGGTYSALSDFGDVNGNSAAAGILKLDVGQGAGESASMDFQKMFPGDNAPRFVWVASSDADSAPNSTLTITTHNLVDNENGCASNSEIAADPTCGDANDPGELSKVVNFQTAIYTPAKTAGQCSDATYPGQGNYQSLFPSGIGNLDTYATGAGTATPVTASTDPTAAPLVLKPGDGVCLAVDIYWPHDYAKATVPDNAAQSDSLTVDFHFDLNQV